ncbi:hypothetical protein [Helicobacter pylori]|uniref:hypothetical protein n=1 Tax=Helicobacter pylori TaxID=210 RepID=UPI001126A2C8|nr:hypothetical protein [Helicobacter pylori]TPH31640.1 hypothetical protein FIM85_05035 [Helicobacter pylori]
MKKDREKKQKYSNITDATIMGSTSEESALHASANREHLSVLDKLEEISKRKINPNYTNQNINQAITNIYECIANGKDPMKAIKHTAIATLKGGVLSYGSAFASSSLGGLMQSSANKAIQSLGKGSVPAMIVGACVANATVLTRYFSGKIDRVECLEELGKENTTFLSGIAMGSIGQLAIPIPVVGALVGGFVGAILSETFFNAFLKAREEAKLAHQRHIEIEKECRESIRLLEAYQNQFNEVFERYFHETTKFFNQNFDELERALYAGDADLAIGVNNKIQERLGQKALFDNSKEGWELITSNKDIRM